MPEDCLCLAIRRIVSNYLHRFLFAYQILEEQQEI